MGLLQLCVTVSSRWYGQTAALACSGLENERAPSYRLLSHDSPWPIKKSKGRSVQSSATTGEPEPWWEALNHVTAQCGSLQQQEPRRQRVSSKTLPWQGEPVVQLKQAASGRAFWLPVLPCFPRQQRFEPFCWRWDFSSYLTTVGLDLFLRTSLWFPPCPLFFFNIFCLLERKMSACQMSCVGRGSAGAAWPWCLMSLGEEALVGVWGGSSTGCALMGLLMLKHDQNKQTK